MIDLHSHVLPDLDDGPRTVEESLEMLRLAAAGGTTDLAATAHANHQYAFDPCAVEARLAELRAAAGPLPRLHYGCELHLTAENIAAVFHSPAAYSIAHSAYLLIELPDVQIPPHTEEIFRRLTAEGLRPILAHPERHSLLQTRCRELETWIGLGCVVQITAQSLLGRFGKSARASASELLRRRLVHLVASDAHDVRHRPPLLDEARRHVEEHFGAPAAELLFQQNPAAILAGDPVSTLAKRRWW
ncbi:MAG TPA: CpsB/CapC family capsule biosynthesis tyrosine phosphatase [Candidatus Sulfopaludibacter sp.]|jgi:protein-tyrosine phosphatase|nr:CpsB/CapC family capsule biosynthesis tyrosine phosphatase [Candidatus Sulfopaludibacter sp.]